MNESGGVHRVWARGRIWLASAAAIAVFAALYFLFQSSPPAEVEHSVRYMPSGGIVPTRTEDSAKSPRTFASLRSDSSVPDNAPGQLSLHAVGVGATPGEGTAELRDATGAVRTFVAGAVLRDGSRLVEIHSDRVLIEKDQQTYTLRLTP